MSLQALALNIPSFVKKHLDTRVGYQTTLLSSFLTARTGASETPRARTHNLKTKHRLRSAFHALASRARAMRYTPASRRGTTAQHHISLPRRHARTSPTALAPSRSTAVGRKPPPPLLPHHNDHQARASDEPPTKHAHAAQVIIVTKHRRIGLSAFRRFSPTCVV